MIAFSAQAVTLSEHDSMISEEEAAWNAFMFVQDNFETIKSEGTLDLEGQYHDALYQDWIDFMLRSDLPERNEILAAFLGEDPMVTSNDDWILAAEANAWAHEEDFPYIDYLNELNHVQAYYAWNFIESRDWMDDDDECDCDDDDEEDEEEN